MNVLIELSHLRSPDTCIEEKTCATPPKFFTDSIKPTYFFLVAILVSLESILKFSLSVCYMNSTATYLLINTSKDYQ